MGWRTTKATKGLLVDELAMAVRVGDVLIWDEHTIAEMKQYVRDPKGGMSGSPFDDRVISVRIANMMRRYASAPEYRQNHDNYMTTDWWASLLGNAAGTRVGGVIGGTAVRSR